MECVKDFQDIRFLQLVEYANMYNLISYDKNKNICLSQNDNMYVLYKSCKKDLCLQNVKVSCSIHY